MKCRIILEKTPNNVGFSIQKGKGTPYEIEQYQLGNGQNLSFECMVQVKKTPDGSIDFSGISIQGTTQARFIYINIGTSARQIDAIWNRRLKVPLRHVGDLFEGAGIAIPDDLVKIDLAGLDQLEQR